MQHCNKRFGLVGAAVIGALSFAPHRASAQIPVTDVAGNAQWLQQNITQIKSLAQQARQYGTQLAQYQTELNQYTNMVTNTVALPTEVWSTVQSDIMRVQALSNASSLLSGSSGSLITRLQNVITHVPSGVGAGWRSMFGALYFLSNRAARTVLARSWLNSLGSKSSPIHSIWFACSRLFGSARSANSCS
jgi:hypothetical protein